MIKKANLMVLVAVILLLVSPLLIGCGENKDDSMNQSLLFFQTISQGTYEDGVLSLEEVLPQVVDYRDSNYRLTGYLDADSFVELWNQDIDDFNANPPMAMLFIAANETGSITLELYSPTANDSTLSFNVKIMSGDMPAQFGAANLFIDAIPAPVNTEAVSAFQDKVLGDAPAVAMGNLYQATAQALANAAQNATNAQHQSGVTDQAATNQGVATLYSTDSSGEILYSPFQVQ